MYCKLSGVGSCRDSSSRRTCCALVRLTLSQVRTRCCGGRIVGRPCGRGRGTQGHRGRLRRSQIFLRKENAAVRTNRGARRVPLRSLVGPASACLTLHCNSPASDSVVARRPLIHLLVQNNARRSCSRTRTHIQIAGGRAATRTHTVYRAHTRSPCDSRVGSS